MRTLNGSITRAVFERRFGIETGDHVEGNEPGCSDPDAVGYEPSGSLTLRRAPAPSLVTSDDVFADPT
jgi:hypothetical protein